MVSVLVACAGHFELGLADGAVGYLEGEVASGQAGVVLAGDLGVEEVGFEVDAGEAQEAVGGANEVFAREQVNAVAVEQFAA